jgi:hypothetical protein
MELGIGSRTHGGGESLLFMLAQSLSLLLSKSTNLQVI